MRKLIYYLLTIFCLSVPALLLAQQSEMDNRQQFALAESEYQVGHIDNAIDILQQQINTYNGTLKVSAYRLLALCSLAQDDLTNANKYVDLLLREDPYYSVTINDPERFAELIRNKKEGKTTLVTASQQAETLEEAPVPVTLITEEMIKAIGARTLKDVLITYVPGMTSVESPNETNVAMHGVYSAGQEKILIMLNSQRMNARITNKAAPDYSIDLEKIKQIEVLRGPASSLYGNVALVAVVNLITKEGIDVDGIEISAGIGNFGQKKANFLIGKRFMNIDFMGWGSFYASDGQKRSISKEEAVGVYPHDGFAWVEAYNHLPSYDIGFTFKLNAFSFIFNQRYGKKVPTFADIHSSMGALYDYDKYRTVNGERAGHGMSFTHAGVNYSSKIQNVKLDVNTYFDLNTSNQYSLMGDSVSGVLEGAERYSCFQIMNWKEYALGGTFLLNYIYPELGKIGKGNLLIGAQLEHIKLYAAEGLVAEDYTNVFMHWPNAPIRLGAETSYSPFLQLKHSFSSHWILNAGVRYDIKRRVNTKHITSLSPRASLIYLLNERFNLKINYARSFVDAPYFYRYNESPSYSGSENLQPEYMQTTQLSISYTPNSKFLYNGVIAYNDLSGFIYRDPNASGEQSRYINAGELKTFCVENTLQYQTSRFFANFNVTYQTVLDGANYTYTGHQIHNVPNWFANISLNGNLLKHKEHELWLYGNGRLTGAQLSPIENILIGGVPVTNLKNELPALYTMNAGLRYKYQRLESSVHFYNLLDKLYYQGGSVPSPYIQQGFSMMFSLKYKIW